MFLLLLGRYLLVELPAYTLSLYLTFSESAKLFPKQLYCGNHPQPLYFLNLGSLFIFLLGSINFLDPFISLLTLQIVAFIWYVFTHSFILLANQHSLKCIPTQSPLKDTMKRDNETLCQPSRNSYYIQRDRHICK